MPNNPAQYLLFLIGALGAFTLCACIYYLIMILIRQTRLERDQRNYRRAIDTLNSHGHGDDYKRPPAFTIPARFAAHHRTGGGPGRWPR